MDDRLYRIGEAVQLIRVDRQSLYKYLDVYDGLYSDSPTQHRRGKKLQRRLTKEAVQRIRLIAMLERDCVFEKKEIKGILRKFSVPEFLELFQTLPFPKLLEELRSRGVPIVETEFLKPLMEECALGSGSASSPSDTGPAS